MIVLKPYVYVIRSDSGKNGCLVSFDEELKGSLEEKRKRVYEEVEKSKGAV